MNGKSGDGGGGVISAETFFLTFIAVFDLLLGCWVLLSLLLLPVD